MNKNLNNTLEEELRIIICDQQDTIRNLRSQIEMMEKMVAEESEQKYRAYVRLADAVKELDKLKLTKWNRLLNIWIYVKLTGKKFLLFLFWCILFLIFLYFT